MYKIPSEKEINEALIKVLGKYKEVSSIKLLRNLVQSELRKTNKYYVVSENRIRKIASKNKKIKIIVLKRKSSKKTERCFICGKKLKPIISKNLLGEYVTIGSKCEICGIVLEKNKQAPKRYIFLVK